MNGVRIFIGDDIGNKDIILNGVELDLHKDESILLTLKQTDFADIGTNFADYTQPFSVPASPKNNKALKYWYDVNNDNQWSSVDGIPARIDIDGILFKKGTVRIINYQSDENGNPKNYSLNFTAGLKSLSDDFGETLISGLSFSSIMTGFDNFTYTDDIIRGMILNNDRGSIEVPIVSVKRILNNYDNIKYQGNNQNGLRKEELRPAVRFSTILEAIEKNYNIKFGGSFVTDFESPLNKMYLWANKNEEPYTAGGTYLDFAGTVTRTVIFHPYIPFSQPTPNYDTGTDFVYINPANNIVRLKNARINYGSGIFNTYTVASRQFYLSIRATTSNSSTQYKYFFQEVKMMADGVTVNEVATKQQPNEGWVWSSDYITGTQTTDPYQFLAMLFPLNTQRFFRFGIESKGSIVFTSLKITVDHYYDASNTFISGPVDYEGNYTTRHELNSTVANTILVKFNTISNLPDITVSDFMRSLIKMYNLVIVPVYNTQLTALFGTEKIFLLDTYKKYYGVVNEFDITKYVKRSLKENKIKTYKGFEFKHADSSYGTNIDFKSKQKPTREYGSVKADYPNGDGDSLKVETKFGLMIWRELPNVAITGTYSLNQTWIIADALNEDYTKGVFNKPTIFFYNGKSSITQGKNLSFVYENNQSNILNRYSIFSNLDKITGLYNTTNTFSTEEMFGQGIKEKSLFYNYYSGLINGVYSPYSREFEVKANLPKHIYTKISLGSQIIIGQKRYSIIDLSLNLINGETTLKLTNAIEEGDIIESDGNKMAPIAPLKFEAKPNGVDNELVWEDAFDDRSGFKNYVIEYVYGTGSDWQYLDTITSSLSFGSYNHIGVTQGATYSYRISVLNDSDIISDGYAHTLVETFDNEPPTLPITIIPQVYGNYIKMDWSGVTDNTAIGGYISSITRTGFTDSNIPYSIATSSSHFSVVYDKYYDLDNFPAPPGLAVITPNTSYDIKLEIYDVYGNSTYSVTQVTTTDSYSYSISDNSQGVSASNTCLVNPPSLPIYTGRPIELVGVGDVFYSNAGLTAAYNGAGEWWKAGSLTDYKFKSYRIASYGEVLEINEGCPDYYFVYEKSLNILDASIYSIEDGCSLSMLGTVTYTYLKKKFEHLIMGVDKLYIDTQGTAFPSASILKLRVVGYTDYYSIRTDSNGVIVETLLCP